MGLQTSGAISLANVQAEFGGSNPIGLNEYYGAAAGVPASGTISINDFYGKSNTFAFTISSNQNNANLATLAANAGWDGSANLEVTIASGVIIKSTSNTTPALSITGSFPSGVTIINRGSIFGKGGDGGRGGAYTGASGGNGGAAILTSVATVINNLGIIYGGGGGGGGGAGYRNSSLRFPGGGGGGGQTAPGTTTAAGLANSTDKGTSQPGQPGSSSGPGAGGRGYWDPRNVGGGTGGRGGTWGSAGGNGGGARSGSPGAGGAAGPSVSGSSNVTWVAVGNRLGPLT